MSGGSKPPKEQTTITKPPEYLEPYLKEAAQAASAEFKQGAPTPYSESLVLPFNQMQEQSMQGMLNTVNSSPYQALNEGVLNANQYALNLPQNIANDPNLKAVADANTQQVQQNLVENTLRKIRGESVGAGTYDSSRTALAESGAIEGAAGQAANANARLYGDAYNNALKYSQVAQSQVPGIQQAMMQPYQIQGTVGDAYASLDQAKAQEEAAKYYQEQQAVPGNIQEYISLLQGTNSGGSSTMMGGGGGGPSSASKLLGAGMTGLGTYSSLAGLAGSGMAGAGALTAAAPWLGAGMGLLSLMG